MPPTIVAPFRSTCVLAPMAVIRPPLLLPVLFTVVFWRISPSLPAVVLVERRMPSFTSVKAPVKPDSVNEPAALASMTPAA